MRLLVIVAALLINSTLAAQTSREARYRELLANELVRVYHLDLPPGHTAPLYQNTHDVFWIALGESNLIVVGEDGTASSLEFRTGDVRLLHSFTGKQLRNDSTSPVRGVLVELIRRGMSTDGCGCLTLVEHAICGCKPSAHLPELWALGLAKLTLAGTMLEPRQSFASVIHRDDMLLVAVTQLHLEDEVLPGASFDLGPGEAAWIKAGDHQFRNGSDAQARFVTIEF